MGQARGGQEEAGEEGATRGEVVEATVEDQEEAAAWDSPSPPAPRASTRSGSGLLTLAARLEAWQFID